MKYIIGAITLVVGLVVNFLSFTPIGTKFLDANYGKIFGLLNHNTFLVLSIIAIAFAIYNLVKNKEKILSVLAIVANLVFVGYFLILFISFGG